MVSENSNNTKEHTVRGYKEWLATLLLYHNISIEDVEMETQGHHLVICYPKIEDDNFSRFNMAKSFGHYNNMHNIGTINAKTR